VPQCLEARRNIPAHKRSPCWHRHRRTRRARARRRLRAAKSLGKCPRASDTSLLYHHHSEPSHCGMGKTWKHHNGSGTDDGWQQQRPGQGSWRLWRGAHSPKVPWKKGNADREPAFPSYTQLVLQDQPASASQSQDHDMGQDGSLQSMHRALTLARKAENKVRALLTQRERSVKMWEAYKQQMEAAYVKEHRQHQQDLTRFQKDLDAALQNQEAARQQVRGAYLGEAPMPSETAHQAQASAVEWARLQARWEHEAANELEGVYRRAISPDASMLVTVPPTSADATADQPQRKLRPEIVRQLLSEPDVRCYKEGWQACMEGLVQPEAWHQCWDRRHPLLRPAQLPMGCR